jgi:hypothetical protein
MYLFRSSAKIGSARFNKLNKFIASMYGLPNKPSNIYNIKKVEKTNKINTSRKISPELSAKQNFL